MVNRSPTSGHISVRRGVIGIIPREQAFLLIQRAAHLRRGGCWCFPGGHLEPGENSRRAVIREIHEELGVIVEPFRRLGAVRVHDSNYILAVWLARMSEAAPLRPNAAEIADARWLTVEEIGLMRPGLPSNQTVLEMLREVRL